MIGICTLPLVDLNCNLWWINVYHVCRQVTRHTAHLHDGSLPGRKIGGGAGRGVWCRSCRCRSDISEKWYFYILDLWNCDGERDMIYFDYFFFILCNFSCWSCWTSFISPTPFCGMLWCSIASFPVSNWALAVVVTSNLRKTTATAAMGSWDVMDVRCMRQLNIIRDALKIWPSASTESWACLH